ncbi:MAG: protein-methionine-sulfoxide reductase heme-binding subunit MsrQ [Pseudomonadota bacterium]
MIDMLNSFFRKVPTWLVYLGYGLPAFYLFYLGISGGLGPEPVRALEHEYGEIAIQLLIIGLMITPLRKLVGLNLLKFRRAIGLLAFFYVALHLLVWLVLDVQFEGVIKDIVKRPYITVGMLAFVIMIPLALTSNNRAVKALGRSWQKLHKLTYLAVLLGGAHFVMQTKGFEFEAYAYLAVILALVGYRYWPKPSKRTPRTT